jgi:hypothetical protein
MVEREEGAENVVLREINRNRLSRIRPNDG